MWLERQALALLDSGIKSRNDEGGKQSPKNKKPGMTPGLMHEPDRENQRLENWKLRRAFALPYFLRSTTRLSRVRKPPFLSTARSSGSK